MDWDPTRREFAKQAAGLAVATLAGPKALATVTKPDSTKQNAMVLWFAHSVGDEKHIADSVARCADHGINTIYFQPRYVGVGVYRSKVVAPFDAQIEKLWMEGTPTFKVTEGHHKFVKDLSAHLKRFDPYDVGMQEVKRQGLRFIAQTSIFDRWFPILPDRFFEQHPEGLLVDRTGKFYFPGLPCYAEPATQDYCLAEIRELIERGAEGISLAMISHQVGYWPEELGERRPDTLGFNPPLVDEYERRYGVNVLREDFDKQKWHDLHGEFFTRFLRRVKEVLKELPLIVGATPEGFLGYGGNAGNVLNPNYADQSPACRINLEWQKWLQEGTVDALRVYAEPPSNVATVEVMKRKVDRGEIYFARETNLEEEIPEYQGQLQQVSRGPLDGYVLHEEAFFEGRPKLWEIFGS